MYMKLFPKLALNYKPSVCQEQDWEIWTEQKTLLFNEQNNKNICIIPIWRRIFLHLICHILMPEHYIIISYFQLNLIEFIVYITMLTCYFCLCVQSSYIKPCCFHKDLWKYILGFFFLHQVRVLQDASESFLIKKLRGPGIFCSFHGGTSATQCFEILGNTRELGYFLEG